MRKQKYYICYIIVGAIIFSMFHIHYFITVPQKTQTESSEYLENKIETILSKINHKITTTQATVTTVKKSAKIYTKLKPLSCLQYEPGTIDTIEEISKVNPRKDRSIFFHETSCKSREAGKVTLNIRQACAIETAARANPSMDIYVLVTAPAVIKNEGTREDKIIQMLLEYPNVNIKHMYLEGYLTNTPVEPLYRSGKIQKSYWVSSHLSDVLRFTTLWKYGGIYLDLDVLVLKSLEKLVKNFSAREHHDYLAAGAMGFASEGKGHEMVEQCMKEVNRDFQPTVWTHNGIGILTKILKSVCKVEKIRDITPETCENYTIYDNTEFYPLFYTEIDKLFNPKYLKEAQNKIKNAYALHLWNNLTANRKLTFGTGNVTITEQIAKEFCPNVYRLCDNQFQ